MLRYVVPLRELFSKGSARCAGEEDEVRKLLLHAPLAIVEPKWTDPHTKANALLQSHFSRAMSLWRPGSRPAHRPSAGTRLLQVWHMPLQPHA